MSEIPEFLKYRILMCFLNSAEENCKVMGISRTLNENKQKISRTMINMEKEGLLDRSNPRAPELTEEGRRQAEHYLERVTVAQNHLLHEGVDIENARRDAGYWALYCSEALMNVIRSRDECYRVKHELRNERTFSGAALCKKLKDGTYSFPFVIYRETIKDNNNVSMTNEGFEHPCSLHIKNGVGMVQLRILPISRKSILNEKLLRGEVSKMEYYDSGNFTSAEFHGNVISFPADALKFVNMGTGVGQVLHGSVLLKLQCSCDLIHMPESKAVFTILI